MSLKPKSDRPTVTIALRWDPSRKVWRILATGSFGVVQEVADTRVSIQRFDVIRVVGAVRNEIESWIPFEVGSTGATSAELLDAFKDAGLIPDPKPQHKT